jgi:hypothetical protein
MEGAHDQVEILCRRITACQARSVLEAGKLRLFRMGLAAITKHEARRRRMTSIDEMRVRRWNYAGSVTGTQKNIDIATRATEGRCKNKRLDNAAQGS